MQGQAPKHTRLYPSLARHLAMSRPIPRVPPVTTATRGGALDGDADMTIARLPCPRGLAKLKLNKFVIRQDRSTYSGTRKRQKISLRAIPSGRARVSCNQGAPALLKAAGMPFRL
jgi:hypothetical protein